MNSYKTLLLAFLSIFVSLTASAQLVNKSEKMRPRWVKNTPKASNSNLSFVVAKEVSNSPNYSKKMSLESLASNLPRAWNVSSQTTLEDESVINRDLSGITSANQTQVVKMKVYAEGLPVDLKCQMIDEYWEQVWSYGQTVYECYQLYLAAAPNTNPPFDKCIVTTSYASDPATWGLSLIPGAAQMHKGSYLKGGLIMGGTVSLAAGALVAENLRNVNKGKIDQTHSADVKKQYNDRVNTCATVRNICLGGLAAVYIYNIVDAFVAPGARRVIVTPTTDGVGVAYNF